MVDQLEVPLPFACLQIDRDQTLGEQIVAGPMAAVEVGCRRLDGQIHEAELLVDGHLVPDAHVAVSCPGFVFPRLVAELAGPWNRLEVPQPLPRAYVERLDEAFGVVVRARRVAFPECGADDDHAAGDGRRRVQADFSGDRIDGLPRPVDGGRLEVNGAVLAERLDTLAVLRVQRDEPEAWR